MTSFSASVLAEFDAHAQHLREAARARRESVQLRAAVDDDTTGLAADIKDTLGVRLDCDRWEGCTNLRFADLYRPTARRLTRVRCPTGPSGRCSKLSTTAGSSGVLAFSVPLKPCNSTSTQPRPAADRLIS